MSTTPADDNTTWPPEPTRDVTFQTYGHISVRREPGVLEVVRSKAALSQALFRHAWIAAAQVGVCIVLMPFIDGILPHRSPGFPSMIWFAVGGSLFGSILPPLLVYTTSLNPFWRASERVTILEPQKVYRDALGKEGRSSDIAWISVVAGVGSHSVVLQPGRLAWGVRDRDAALALAHEIGSFIGVPVKSRLKPRAERV